MVGISYPGISQLFVARTQPPSLKAITPLSVNDDTLQGTLYPGGILNTGFAASWGQERFDSALPSIDADGEPTDAGQGWTVDQIATGDDECAANQGVRLQNPDTGDEIRANRVLRPDASATTSSPQTVRRRHRGADVPRRSMAGRADRRPLPHDARSVHRHRPLLRHAGQRAAHRVDQPVGAPAHARVPRPLRRRADTRPRPRTGRRPDPGRRESGAPTRSASSPTASPGSSYADALAAFEAEPPIEILFEQGAAEGATPLAPLARFSERFDAWPIPSVEPTVWHLGTGTLTPDPVAEDARVDYRALPDTSPATYWTGNSSDLWRTDVVWDWQEPAEGIVRRLPHRAADRDTHDGRVRVGRPLDHEQHAATPTSRSRSPSCDPTGPRCSCSPVGCAPATERSTRPHRPTSVPSTPTSKPTPSRSPTRRRGRQPRSRDHRCVRPRPRRDLPVRPRLPRRLPDPADGRRTRRQPRRVGVRHDLERRTGPDRTRTVDAVAARAPRRSRHRATRRGPRLRLAPRATLPPGRIVTDRTGDVRNGGPTAPPGAASRPARLIG